MPEWRIRRSVLMTPGNRPERLLKAMACAADVLVFDLEDGVPPDQKAAARVSIAQVLREAPRGDREICVRINGMATPDCSQDLAALPFDLVDTIMVPKVESAAELSKLDRTLASLGCDCKRERPVELIATLETPRGILNALSIADASARNTALFFGSGDYTSALGAPVSDSVLQYPRSVVAAAAAAAGLQAIDAAFFQDVKNTQATRRDALLARELGFSGKVVFHPDQIAVANQVFSPTPEELDRAKLLISTYRDSIRQGHGTAVGAGVFVAVDLVVAAERVLKLADAIEARRKD